MRRLDVEGFLVSLEQLFAAGGGRSFAIPQIVHYHARIEFEMLPFIALPRHRNRWTSQSMESMDMGKLLA
jgi:hypothetical protein